MGVDPADLVFVPNATTGINTVLRSLCDPAHPEHLRPGDELLTTDHEYNASRNSLAFAAAWSGARVVVAPIPFPIADAEQAIAAVLNHLSPRTRLVLLDHVTSQTGLVLPIAPLVQACRERGIATLIDGAHAPGMVPPVGADLIGAMVSLPLPSGLPTDVYDRLWQDFRIEVPIIPWQAPYPRLIRISAQLYNRLSQYEYLADAIGQLQQRG